MKDWEGRDVLVNESPADEIRVWEISPGGPVDLNLDHDYILCRGFDQARRMAHSLIDAMMDKADPETIEDESIEVRVRLVRMTLADYLEIVGDDA